jgi:2-hydroxy-6-oxonona-2,4-dienedioate hydrolase
MTTSIWVDLLGADVRIVEGARFKSRILEAGQEHAETLILTHAGGGHVETYARNIVPLGKRVHAVGVEMLWHGLSDGPPIEDDRIAQEGEQVLDVMDAIGVEKAWVASHGSGGVVLTWLALRHPDRLKGLVYEATTGGVKVETNAPPPPPPTPGAVSFQEMTLRLLADPTWEAVRQRLLPAMHPDHPERITDELVDVRLAHYSRRSTNEAMVRYYSSHAAFSATEAEAAGIAMPVLVFASDSRGETSLVGPRRLAEVVPGAQFKVLEGTGQWGHWEAADGFNDAIFGFVLGGGA